MNFTWHLRFSVTARCNFSCIYCNPNNLYEYANELSTQQVFNILTGAYESGIKRIHWTGGEPMVRKDMLELVKKASDIGFTDQIMTTNGSQFFNKAEELKKSGLSRVNISLDTLDPNVFHNLTAVNCYENVQNSIRKAIEILPNNTKINIVTFKDTLNHLEEFINYAVRMNSNKSNSNELILKFICIMPNNPALSEENGKKLFLQESASYDDFLNALSSISSYEKVPSDKLVGDNPNCEYYLVKGVKVGIIAMPSWCYKCGEGRCKKMRVTPFGKIKSCLEYELEDVSTLSSTDIKNVMSRLIMSREEIKDYTSKKHFNPQLGETRFGKTHESVDLEDFLLERV